MIEIIKNKRPLLMFFLFLLTGGIVSVWLKNELTYDYLLYHYYNGFAFVNARHGIDLAVAFLPTYYNPLLDAVSYLLIRFCADNLDLYYFIAGLPFGLLMFVFFKICLLFFDQTTLKGKIQIAATLLIAATGLNIFTLIGSSSHDISSNVFSLAAFYFLTGKDKKFFIAGFLLGSGSALKLVMVIYCISGGLTLLLMYKKLPCPLKNISAFALGGFIGFMLFNGFWMYFLWEKYQNPFFPFWNAVFKSPYYPFINYTDKLASSQMQWLDYVLLPFYLINHSVFSNIMINIDVMDARLACLFIIASGFVLRFLKTKTALSPEMFFLSVLMAVSYIVWIFLSTNTRFLIPIEMFAAIAIVSCFSLIKYPRNMFTEGLYWSLLIILIFYFCSVPHYSSFWGKRTSNKLLNEKIVLPENTLILGFGEFSPAFIAQIIENNPSAKAIGFHSVTNGHWKQWNMSGYGKMAEIKQEMLNGHKNKVAFETLSFKASFLPAHEEKENLLKNWICEELSSTEDVASFNAIFKLCYPPEMKEKIIIERN